LILLNNESQFEMNVAVLLAFLAVVTCGTGRYARVARLGEPFNIHVGEELRVVLPPPPVNKTERGPSTVIVPASYTFNILLVIPARGSSCL
jgi:hypothetical protein